jgi:hypothetical protein
MVFRCFQTRGRVKGKSLAFFLAGLCVCVFLLRPARGADDPFTQKMTYQVYAGGIDALTAEVGITYNADATYRVELSAWTHGFLARLAPWSGSFLTTGVKAGGRNLVRRHKSVAIWRNEPETKVYTYDEGVFSGIRITEKGKDKTPKKIPPELTQGTTDVLTAALTALESAGTGKACDAAADIYDGKRRYTLTFRDLGHELLGATPYNIYGGDAEICEAEVTPGPGDWPKKPRGWLSIQEQGRLKGSLPTMWVARLDPRGPAIPVKIRVRTDYGTLLMHLSAYQSGSRVPPVSAPVTTK